MISHVRASRQPLLTSGTHARATCPPFAARSTAAPSSPLRSPATKTAPTYQSLEPLSWLESEAEGAATRCNFIWHKQSEICREAVTVGARPVRRSKCNLAHACANRSCEARSPAASVSGRGRISSWRTLRARPRIHRSHFNPGNCAFRYQAGAGAQIRNCRSCRSAQSGQARSWRARLSHRIRLFRPRETIAVSRRSTHAAATGFTIASATCLDG